MNRYIKVPLVFGMMYALLFGFMSWLDYGFTGRTLSRVIFNFVFGTLLGFVLLFIHNYYVEGVKRDASEEDFDVRQCRTVLLHLPFDEAFELCKESLSGTRKIKIKKEDRRGGRIEAKTGATSKTWGNLITFSIETVGEQLTRIEVSSRPLVRTILVDYGENLSNVEKISEFLSMKDDHLDVKRLNSGLNLFQNPQFKKTSSPLKHLDAE